MGHPFTGALGGFTRGRAAASWSALARSSLTRTAGSRTTFPWTACARAAAAALAAARASATSFTPASLTACASPCRGAGPSASAALSVLRECDHRNQSNRADPQGSKQECATIHEPPSSVEAGLYTNSRVSAGNVCAR